MARGSIGATGSAEPIRITTAAPNRADDIAARQRRYLISMTIRTVCFVGAIAASLAGLNWLWPLLMVAALLLPYFAVVAANNSDTSQGDVDLPSAQSTHRALPPSDER